MHSGRVILLAAASLLAAAHASAVEPTTLRLAVVAPEGTGWAREFKALSRDTETLSNGQLRVKWYFGGIVGDESAVPARIKRGQIDGEAASVTCARFAPSLRVLRVLGLFRRREEARAVLAHLMPTLQDEFHKAGYEALSITWFGSDVAFSRQPIRSFEDLQHTRLWIWNLDPVWNTEMKMLGIPVVPLPIEEAGRAYDEGRIDGFIALPSAALAFQWSARTRYVSKLVFASFPTCFIVSSSVFQSLPFESQEALRAAAAKATLRFEDLNAAQEDTLLGGLFDRQGTHVVEAGAVFRTTFLEAARTAREKLEDSVVPRALVLQVLGWLSDYRAEHP